VSGAGSGNALFGRKERGMARGKMGVVVVGENRGSVQLATEAKIPSHCSPDLG